MQICAVKLTFSELFHDQKRVCGRYAARPLLGKLTVIPQTPLAGG